MNWAGMKQSVRIKLNLGRVSKMTFYKSRTSNCQDSLVLVNVNCPASAMLLVKAYVTSIYLGCVQGTSVTTNLIFSKARVAPNKSITLPRLELLAVLIRTRSLRFVEESLQVNITEQILWTDSQLVLRWIKSNKMLSPFVQQRIDKIIFTGKIDFRYISTHDNSSDIASRGIIATELKESKLWWHGPERLKQEKEKWPTWDVNEISRHAC